MNSRLDPTFVKQFRRLPAQVQRLANANYRLWRDDPSHPSLNFKPIHAKLPIYSIRIGLHFRALGVKRDAQTIVWFFIGSHAEYDKAIARLR